MTGGIPGEITDWYHGGRAIDFRKARIRIEDQEQEKDIDPKAKGVKFTFSLNAGITRLQTSLTDADGVSIGAYYVYTRQLG